MSGEVRTVLMSGKVRTVLMSGKGGISWDPDCCGAEKRFGSMSELSVEGDPTLACP
jgi:hypothetical protein